MDLQHIVMSVIQMQQRMKLCIPNAKWKSSMTLPTSRSDAEKVSHLQTQMEEIQANLETYMRGLGLVVLSAPIVPPVSLPTSPPSPPSIVSSIATQYSNSHPKKLRSIYNTDYEPPQWAFTDSSDFDFDQSITFYLKSEAKDNVIKVSVEREPVNIAMNRYYNQDQCQAHLGWKTGAYEQSSVYRLMPNLAVYCHATVKQDDFTNKFHVLNLVGLAFDSKKQPDAQYFLGHQNTMFVQQHLLAAITLWYENMWNYVLACIDVLKTRGTTISSVVLSHVGAKNFSILLGLGDEKEFIKVVESRATWCLRKDLHSKQIRLLDFPMTIGGTIIPYFNVKNATDLKHPPSVLGLTDGWEQNTLFLNAWDPWSIIGNGNGKDDSLDGFWGRMSNLSVLGWPLTNPSMSFVPVEPAVFSYEAYVRRIVETQKKGVLLITTGSYNPVHKTHLILTKTAMDQLNADPSFVSAHGPVLAAVMSPSHDKYVFTSSKSDPAQTPATHRLQMIRLGLQDLKFDNVFVDRWEMDQNDFVDFPDTARHYFQVWDSYNSLLGSEITVMYLCGSDLNTGPISVEDGVIPLVVMTRQGSPVTSSNNKYVVTIPSSKEYNAGASSSAVRKAIKANDQTTLETLLTPSVLEYIQTNHLFSVSS
jgi:nicotinic acid mononucleotide adenylyltransferase